MLESLVRAGRAAVRAPRSLYGNLRRNGVRHTKDQVAYALAAKTSRGVADRVGNPGTPVWDRDWDVLVVLDACRRDLLREVADEYDVVGGRDAVSSHWSVGSMSEEWLRHTFTDEYAAEIDRTAYVTGNPFTAKDVFETEPAVLDEVWRDAWDHDRGTVLPRPVTDAGIETWRTTDVDRMIVHYMQPHYPFVTDPDLHQGMSLENFAESDIKSIWNQLRDDEVPRRAVWSAYRDNLRYVLDDVTHFCGSVDADTVAISADHGNATGRFGVWGHPPDLLLPSLRRVPWVETTAEDTGGYEPDADRATDDEGGDVEERLRSLGYVE